MVNLIIFFQNYFPPTGTNRLNDIGHELHFTTFRPRREAESKSLRNYEETDAVAVVMET